MLIKRVIICRVVILNDKGLRVLDTLISTGTVLIHVKPGVKSQLFKIANLKGPSLDEVKKKVLEIIKGRKVAGYLVLVKLEDLGIVDLLSEDDLKNLYEISKCFNQNSSDPQWPLASLCKSHLNLIYKRPFPYAVCIQLTIKN